MKQNNFMIEYFESNFLLYIITPKTGTRTGKGIKCLEKN
jgi:hypothetical protein